MSEAKLICPTCGSADIELVDDGEGWGEYTCNGCNFHWYSEVSLDDNGNFVIDKIERRT